jgi:hypothetical protein
MKKHSIRWNSNLEWRDGEVEATYVSSNVVSVPSDWLTSHTLYGIVPIGTAIRIRTRDNSWVETDVKYGWVMDVNLVGGSTRLTVAGFTFTTGVHYVISIGRTTLKNGHLAASHRNLHVSDTFVEKGAGAELTWNTDGNRKMEFFDNNGGSLGGFSFYVGSNSSYSLVSDINPVTGTYTTYSDIKFKSDLKEISEELGLEFVKNVAPYTYKFKGMIDDLGFIAQDVEKYQPLLTERVEVSNSTEANLTLAYMKICVMQQAALRGMVKKIDDLERRVSDLVEQSNGGH